MRVKRLRNSNDEPPIWGFPALVALENPKLFFESQPKGSCQKNYF
jgi:hypothetical protein